MSLSNENPYRSPGQLLLPSDGSLVDGQLSSPAQLPQPSDGPLNNAGQRPEPALEPDEFFPEVYQAVSTLDKPIVISCHCKRIKDVIKVLPASEFSNTFTAGFDINHEDTGRHYSGQLAVTYFQSFQPHRDTLAKTVCFRLGGYDRRRVSTLYFCPVCGCHLFKENWEPRAGKIGPTWAVTTGAVQDIPGIIYSSAISRHLNVDQTGDGGLSIWMRARINGSIIQSVSERPPPSQGDASRPPTLPVNLASTEMLAASCYCGNVKFHVTRPTHESTLAKSPYSDMIIPFFTRSPEIANPDDRKWWLRGNRYFAGICACDSCRECSGFDMQTWAFIPRANIFMHHPDKPRVLDFSNLPVGMLRSYNSSPGVTREFCPGCGATVFWHNTGRPELIDVSVGLFRAPEGARAESWLDWCKERVSFAEDRRGPHGSLWDPVTCLEKGLGGSIEPVTERK